jgi:hypothetical protein
MRGSLPGSGGLPGEETCIVEFLIRRVGVWMGGLLADASTAVLGASAGEQRGIAAGMLN